MKVNKLLKILTGIVIFLSFSSGLKIHNGGISVSLAQVFVLVLFFTLLIISTQARAVRVVLFTDSISLLIYAYFATNLLSTLLFCSDIYQSLKGCVVILSYVLTYWVIRSTIRIISSPRFGIDQLFKSNAASVIFGLTCFLVAMTTSFSNLGVSFDHLGAAGGFAVESKIPSIRAFSIEPNLFSIITACIVSSSLTIYLFHKRTYSSLALLFAALGAILFSFTRSVYVSLSISVFVMALVSNRSRFIKSVIFYSVLGAAVAFSTYFLLPQTSSLKQTIKSRITSLVDFNSGTGLARVESYKIAIDGFEENPFLGLGCLSANTKIYNPYKDEFQEKMGSPGWLNGAFLQAIHDTGIVGFSILVCLFYKLVVMNYRIFRKMDDDLEAKSILLGFIGGNCILLVSSQFSSVLWISFPYVYWAVNLEYIAYCKQFVSNKLRLQPSNSSMK